MGDRDLNETSQKLYAVRTALNASTATAVGSNAVTLTEWVLQADPANTDSIKIGSSTVQCWVLAASETFDGPTRNPGEVYAISTSGTQYVNLVGRLGGT